MPPSLHDKTESVLIIVLAETRAYEYTFDLFKKNLLDILEADLCLCVANNQREDTDNPFYQFAKYIWTYEEPEDWGDAFDNAQKIKGCKENWRKLLEIKDQWLGGVKDLEEHPGSAGILLFFRWFLKESIINHNVLEKYDRFVVTRSDFIHQVPHVPLKFLCPEKIWLPCGEDYDGFTDRHIIAHRDEILKVLSISDKIISNPEKLFSEMSFSSEWNLERYIKFSFSQLGISKQVKRFPYTMYSIRLIDGHTRWRGGNYNSKLGYYIKYRNEYRGYRLASALVKKPEDWNKFKIYFWSTVWSPLYVFYSTIYKFRINKLAEKIDHIRNRSKFFTHNSTNPRKNQ